MLHPWIGDCYSLPSSFPCDFTEPTVLLCMTTSFYLSHVGKFIFLFYMNLSVLKIKIE